MQIFPSARQSMPADWPGRPRQWPAWNVACSTGSARRSRAPHRSYATRRTSHFSAHTHGGGEEFLVLDGVFQDEHGDFPAGCYIRNPPTSSHTPGSATGCTIFVKLWQFDPNDRTHVRIDTGKRQFTADRDHTGVELMPLFQDSREDVRLEHWAPHAHLKRGVPGGIELLVLDGGFSEGGENFMPQSWLRLPRGSTLQATAAATGCRLWVKSGHLAHDESAPARAAVARQT